MSPLDTLRSSFGYVAGGSAPGNRNDEGVGLAAGHQLFSLAGLRNLSVEIPVVKNMSFQNIVEEVQVLGRDLVDTVHKLIHEGNVQRIIVKDEHGNTFVEIPVTVAAVGVVLAPLLAAVGAISALVAKFTIVVVRSEPKPPQGSPPAP
jgi:hypothetical protein